MAASSEPRTSASGEPAEAIDARGQQAGIVGNWPSSLKATRAIAGLLCQDRSNIVGIQRMAIAAMPGAEINFEAVCASVPGDV
jgi:hypothetical protein